MPIIPSQPQLEHKDTLSLRLDHAVHERLKQYADFIQSPKDYIIGQALRRLFRKDKEFTAWIEARESSGQSQSSSALPNESDAPANGNGRGRHSRHA
jgi:hypothetical protein